MPIPIEKTILTYVKRIQQAFKERSKEESAEFIRGGRAALEIADAAFQETSFSNVKLELVQVQAELEEVSEDLVRAREQNRLQVLEIERLKKRNDRKKSVTSQQHAINQVNARWTEKISVLAVLLATGKQVLGMPPPDAQERIDTTLKHLGSMLANSSEITEEERKVARQLSQIITAGYRPKQHELLRQERTPVANLQPEKPSTDTHRKELAKLQVIMMFRDKWEKLKDKTLPRLVPLLVQPSDELRAAVVGNPVLEEHLRKWDSVVGLLGNLVAADENKEQAE